MKNSTFTSVGQKYSAPTIEVISLTIERGFAVSTDSEFPGGGTEDNELNETY